MGVDDPRGGQAQERCRVGKISTTSERRRSYRRSRRRRRRRKVVLQREGIKPEKYVLWYDASA